MSRFGWDLPPGVTTSMLPGNSPGDEDAERAADDLHNAFFHATLAYFSPSEIMTLWREAAEDAAYAEMEIMEREAAEVRAEMEAERLAEQYWEERGWEYDEHSH